MNAERRNGVYFTLRKIRHYIKTSHFRLAADGRPHLLICHWPMFTWNHAKGASQMLSDPEWEAEDQKRARARTSVGNNSDYDKGGDIISWVLEEKSNREETKNIDSKKKPAHSKEKNCQSPRGHQ